MSYALVLTDEFLESFSQLDLGVQEAILDDLERLADGAGETFAYTPGLRRIEAHRHRGSVDGIVFDLVTAVIVDTNIHAIAAIRLLDRRRDADS